MNGAPYIQPYREAARRWRFKVRHAGGCVLITSDLYTSRAKLQKAVDLLAEGNGWQVDDSLMPKITKRRG